MSDVRTTQTANVTVYDESGNSALAAAGASATAVVAVQGVSGGTVLPITATNLSTNLAQVNGVTTLAGNGASGTGAQRVTLASDSTGQVAPAANATATGVTMSYQSALTNTKIVVKASAGNLYGYRIYNPNATIVYIQIFNVATGSVTLGTTVPNDVIPVPPATLIDETFTIPTTYGTAITLAATTTAGGLTAPSSTLIATFRYA